MTPGLSSRTFSLWSALVVLGAVALAGCAGPPVPMRAVAGTTFGLAIGSEDGLFGYGYAYGSATFPDPQRGVLGVEFKLGSTVQATVPVKLVTRVNADPATQAALTGLVANPVFAPIYLVGQVVALVDIPKTLPQGAYTLTIRRYQTATATTVSGLIDQGPPENAQWSNALYIEAGDGNDHFTPFTGAMGTFGGSLTPAHVQQLVPFPELMLALPSGTVAATIDISYPNAKAQIQGAYFYRGSTHSMIVETQAIDTNTVRIHAIDPKDHGHYVSLVFKNTQTGYNPIAIGEFTYDGGVYYDDEGVEIDAGVGYNPISEIK